MTHPLRETIARAIDPGAWEDDAEISLSKVCTDLNGTPFATEAEVLAHQRERREAAFVKADAVLSAIEAPGMVIVPAYPPDAAIWAGCDTARQRYDKTCKRCPREVYTPYGLGTQACRLEGHDIYQAMVKAAATSDTLPPPAAP